MKLFIFFFLTYSLFVHWVGWNEYSRLDLTRTIVDEGRFEIDTYHNNTGDSAYYNGHYYSDKAPGMSFLAIPAYFVAKQFSSDEGNPTYIEEKVTFQKNVYADYNTSKIERLNASVSSTTNLTPTELELNSMVLIIISTSVLFSSLGAILIYRLSGFFLTDENKRLVATFTYGLGTLIFPYALVFFDHSTSAFFVILSFYIIFSNHNKPDKMRLFLAGVVAGLAVVISYVNVLVIAPVIVYGLFVNRRKLSDVFTPLIAGLLLGITPLVVYNAAIFGNPLQTGYNHLAFSDKPIDILILDPSLSEQGKSGRAATLFSITPLQLGSVLPRILFFPYRGLFFYYPVMIFSFLGFFYMWKRYKAEAVIVLSMFVLILIFNTFFGVWWGGGSFGPRYMTILIPFLMIPMFFFIERLRKGPLLHVFSLLLLLSFFHNIIGLQHPEDIKFASDEDLTYRLSKFTSLGNPLYDYYLPLFLENGPRSKLVDNIFDDIPGTDIRNFKPPPKEGKLFTFYPFGTVLLNFKFLPLLAILVLFLLLWAPKTAVKKMVRNRILILVVLFALFLIMSANLRTAKLVYSNNWNAIGTNETGRWMAREGTVYLYSDKTETAALNLTITSFNNQFDIDMYLNGKLLEKFKVNPALSIAITKNLEIKKGENVVKFISIGKCLIPFVEKISDDRRCLSVNILNITITEVENKNSVIYVKNWYLPEKNGRWMSDQGSILIIRENNSYNVLNMSIVSYNKARLIDIMLNNKTIRQLTAHPDNETIANSIVLLNKGSNTLDFYTANCELPADIENSSDKRCLSIFLNDFEVRHGT